MLLVTPLRNGGDKMSEYADLVKNPKEWSKIKYDDPRLDAFATDVEKRYGLPNGMIVALKNAGERTNISQVSPKGAKGVMQFIDTTRKAYPHDVADPFDSIDASGRYMADLVKQYKNPIAAIAAYNGGGAAAKAVLAGKEPPAEETRNYISRIKTYLDNREKK
jgi:soluble lytic murein transglycosylase-like protein